MRKVTLAAVLGWLLCVSLVAQANWYSGGDLHGASALEWQQASDANKLATAADFVSTMHQGGHFKAAISRQISDVNSLRPLAQELVNQLNDAFEPDPDPAENRRLFSNMKVGESAALLMIMMGWVEQ
ncbi:MULTISPECIES: hypothetical protein [unclassified Halomonas]|uniref:hypothetical protein n=1 Tax=unclassified Halomonas TaxID=2609666 RepID=UPI001CF1E57F|nr:MULTISPECIES: hypothetical protein [unclassified Halomonas]MCA8865591.1 hypothetical protein [Halomonas sp. SBBP1]UZH10449.1 hypothetical protein OM794_01395 [Halomonas sp. BDJS001]